MESDTTERETALKSSQNMLKRDNYRLHCECDPGQGSAVGGSRVRLAVIMAVQESKAILALTAHRLAAVLGAILAGHSQFTLVQGSEHQLHSLTAGFRAQLQPMQRPSNSTRPTGADCTALLNIHTQVTVPKGGLSRARLSDTARTCKHDVRCQPFMRQRQLLSGSQQFFPVTLMNQASPSAFDVDPRQCC